MQGLSHPSGEAEMEHPLLAQLERLSRENAAMRLDMAAMDLLLHAFAHEFRAPIRAALGFAEVLKEETDPEAMKAIADRVAVAVAKLSALMDSYKELLLNRDKTIHLQKRKISLDQILDVALTALQEEIEASEALIELDGVHLAEVEIDPELMVRVFINLIRNAILYAHEARTPIIRVQALELPQTWGIQVIDNGAGISFTDPMTVFEPMRRGQTEKPGMGIGLTLCKRIVEAHGGTIEATTTPGEGSIFTFTLPKILRAA